MRRRLANERIPDVPRTHLRGAIETPLGDKGAGPRLPAHEEEWVLDEVAPYPRQIDHRGDAMALELICRTYARQHEKCREP